MRITDMISITELSRLIGKSRPTVYKYISDYEHGYPNLVPVTILELFERIAKENISRKEVLEYCEKYYSTPEGAPSALEEVISLLRNNQEKLDLGSLKERIKQEIASYEK